MYQFAGSLRSRRIDKIGPMQDSRRGSIIDLRPESAVAKNGAQIAVLGLELIVN